MIDLVSKLVQDLRWRMSRAGKRFKPSNKEITSWGPLRIPQSGSILIWICFILFSTLGVPVLLPDLASQLKLLLFGWPAWVVSFFLLTRGVSLLNRKFIIDAYRKLLGENERFTLVEYNRYLGRRIKQAMSDESLGGPGEVRRLQELQSQLHTMLRGGLGNDGPSLDSVISQEADFAEAYIQSYKEITEDPLSKLDQKMPEELMARVQELEREEASLHVSKKQIEN